MPLVQPSPLIKYQFFDANGDPLSGGLVYTYEAGTTTPLATYTDHNGNVANTNPIVLDAGGFADIWVTAASYKMSVHDSDDVALYTVDGIPGIGSLISVGDLSPLFTSDLTGGALTFTLSDAAAGTLFGRFAGTTGAPSYGAIGSTTQVTFNNAGQMAGSEDFTFDPSAFTLSIKRSGNNTVRLIGGASGGEVRFGTSTNPAIHDFTDWEFASKASQDLYFGTQSNLSSFVVGGGNAVAIGTVRISRGSNPAIIRMNDGTSGSGVFAGAQIVMGSIADPNGTIQAEIGSVFLTTNGGAGTTLWVKESAPTIDTGWVGK